MRPAPLRPQQVQDREITPDGPRSKITDGVNYSNTLNHLLPLHNPIQYTVYLTPTIRTKQGITPGSKKITKRKSKHIDVHSHVVPKEMLDALSQRPERFKMRYVVDGKHRRVVRDGGGGQPVFDEFFDPAAKLAGMDRKGLDVSIISPAPIAYFLKKLKILPCARRRLCTVSNRALQSRPQRAQRNTGANQNQAQRAAAPLLLRCTHA